MSTTFYRSMVERLRALKWDTEPNKTEAPRFEKTPGDVLNDSIETHPAYANIAASRVSGRAFLYGSDFAHQHYVTIRISASEKCRGLSEDRYYGDSERYIEVALSESQWATFVSTLNTGSGVPCTLGWIIGQGYVPRIPEPIVSTREKFAGEMNEMLADVEADAKRLAELIELGKGKPEMRQLVSRIAQGLRNSSTFIADQFGEHMEKTTEKAKIEINAYANAMITRTGLAALKGGATPPISLPEEKPKGGDNDEA